MIIARPLRKFFWTVSSFFKKHKLLIEVAAVVGALLFLFNKNLLPFIPRPKSRLKIGLVGQYTINNLPSFIPFPISRGLIKLEEDGQPSPDLAESWTIHQQETVYRFVLKPNLTWSDGSLLSAKDLQFNINDVIVSYPDNNTIEFELKEPFSPFLTRLSQPLFKDESIGAGKFLIKKADYQSGFLKNLNLVSPQQDIDYHFYSSNQAAWLGFKSGEVDQLVNLFNNPLDEKWEKKVELKKEVNNQQYLAVIFNLNDPNLGNKSLRQALAYATANKSLDPSSRALTSISPKSWAFNADVKPYHYNETQAKELFDKFSEDASLSGKLTISLGTSQSFLSMAEEIGHSWEKVLDLEVAVKIVNTIENDFQALIVAQDIPFDPDQHALWHSTQTSNITHYSDLKVDKLLEDGRTVSDYKDRIEIYHDFQRFLVEDTPAIFLMHPTIYHVMRK